MRGALTGQHGSKGPRGPAATMAALALLVAGCTPQQHRAAADREVYGILEAKWTDAMGPRGDYRLAEALPPAESVRLADYLSADGVLDLPHAIALAAAGNRAYRLERELLYLEALDLTLVRHQYAPNVLALGSGGYLRQGLHGLPTQRSADATGQVLLQQLYLSGATLTADVANGFLKALTGDVAGGWQSVATATVTQPLLRGFGPDVAGEPLLQAERDALRQLRSFCRFRQTFLTDVVNQYYLVLEQLHAVRNARRTHEALLAQHDRLKKMADVGMVARFEVDQAHNDALRAEDAILNAENAYRKLLDEYRQFLGVPVAAGFRLDEGALEAVRRDGLGAVEWSQEEAVAAARRLRLDLANRADTVEEAERKLVVAADRLRTELTVVATGNVTSTERSSDLRGMRFNDTLLLGLRLDLPVDRLAERNAYRAALIALEQSRREHDETLQQVVLEVRSALGDVREAASRYRVQQDSVALAERRVQDTSTLLQHGRASTRDVLDAERDLFAARNGATSALVNYAMAKLRLQRDTGLLRVEEHGLLSPPPATQPATRPASQPDTGPATQPAGGPTTEPATGPAPSAAARPVGQTAEESTPAGTVNLR